MPEEQAVNHHAPHTGARAERDVFCAGCQAQTKHVCSVDRNNEVLCTCDVCGRALKLPFPEHAEHLNSMLDAHHQANVGQIRTEVAEAERAKLDAQFLAMMGVK